jgi:hypothetical protein
MVTGKITLAQLRFQSARVFGADFKSALDYPDGPCFTVALHGRQIDFAAKTRASARRLAYEVLRKLPSTPGVP